MSDNRRAFLRLAGLASVGLLAGCSGNGGSGGGTPEPTPTPTESEGTETSGSGGSGSGSSGTYDGWLDGVGNFDGVVDRTGQSEVTVQVGAEGNGGNFAFDPAAVRVDAGTTVVWEWTGQGAQHNVKAEEGAEFESELVTEAGFTFEQTFDGSGVVKYVCTPHRSLGMKGVVDVQ